MNQLISFLLSLITLFSISPAIQQKAAVGDITTTPWPLFYGQVGPYSVQNAQEITDLANAGFGILLTGYNKSGTAMYKAITANNVKYIDPYIWGNFRQMFSEQIKPGTTWAPTSDQEQSFLDLVSEHLAITSQDPNIIGYWILDDYPNSDIHNLLEEVHTLVSIANKKSIFARPTVCGFGGYLDSRVTTSDNFVSDTASFERASVNFSPSACDMVAIYSYGANKINDPQLVDWSMEALLPKMFQLLRNKGWDQDKQPLIGMPHTFSYTDFIKKSGARRYVLPTELNVITQVEAYCKAGAIALLPYSWNDSYSGPKNQLYNTPYLVEGLKKGVDICKKDYWNVDISDEEGAINLPPNVGTGEPKTITLPNNSVTLDGEASDPDNLPLGRVLVFTWTPLTNVSDVTLSCLKCEKPIATFSKEGIYDLQLTVSDGDKAASKTTTVTVLKEASQGNTAPRVDLGVTKTITWPEMTIEIDGKAEDDGRPTGSALAYQWSVESGTVSAVSFANAQAKNTRVTFAAAGFYRLKLTVSDSLLSDSGTMEVEVKPADDETPTPQSNQAPEVSAPPPTAPPAPIFVPSPQQNNPQPQRTVTPSKPRVDLTPFIQNLLPDVPVEIDTTTTQFSLRVVQETVKDVIETIYSRILNGINNVVSPERP